MKNVIAVALAMMLLFSVVSCSRAHYVSAQPETVVETRPAAPGPNYVWVDGDYVWVGGRYVYHPGYWVAPRASRIWVPGAWVKTPRGFYWQRGHWR